MEMDTICASEMKINSENLTDWRKGTKRQLPSFVSTVLIEQ